ncbi:MULTISPECIES: hypothetical protein [Priestia]|uniref:hypothetical protein n=1 Tax=Priestia TaxID=2800373 RepID=UPI0008ED572C|nr:MULTISPECIES: hypothetical protein [Priestia]MBX9997658.1 hypothetical protein [Priestia aryabhattai]MCM3154559.1 hypothetical protein [Priestia megaterium]MCU7743918.1 hypothetical protein [Priestia megaterium]PFW45232.1 hypothetical protein COL17_24980 [Priestia megaterium]PGY54079.1 hypothetical protein COE35_03545 [Priestia megaterium]
MQNSDKNVEEFSSQLSAKIWGHRFKDGQRGPEYVLEFLNVLYGTDYQLNADCYFRNKSQNLRKFIFEGVKEGSKRGSAQLDQEKKKFLYEKLQDDNKIEVIRDFFRNLEIPLVDGKGKEADRSWYARSLYPLHESLLFFELRVKGENTSYERNFFARGGELYYLMVSYGAKNFPGVKHRIEQRFQQLLQKNNSVGQIVDSIQSVLGDEGENKSEDRYPLKKVEKLSKEYPHLPIEEHELFDQFAEEMSNLLNLDIDVYDMFKLLTSLTCFHILLYMYERSKVDVNDRIEFFFDCLDGKNKEVQKISTSTFKNNEILIKEKFEDYFSKQFFSIIGHEEEVNRELSKWKEDPMIFIEKMGLQKLQSRKKRVINSLQKCKNYEDVKDKLHNVVKEVISDTLKRHQISINRTLARDGGVGNFKAGSSYRYLMTDTFLQTLVFINVKPKESIEFSEFLNMLYKKYGFIVGEMQARESALYDRSKVNIRHYQKNELALREKLRKNGLLVEYSDATAMIRNPYEMAEGVMTI